MPLTASEKALADSVGFDHDVCLALQELSRERVRQAEAQDEEARPVAGNGIAIDVADAGEAERVVAALEPVLAPGGYRAYWSMRHAPNGLRESDEVIVLKSSDPYAIVRFRRPDGGNYGISTEDILDRLRAWEELCAFEVVGASTDWVALQFRALPADLCAFAVEVYTFCPDTVTQGVGLTREADDPELFAAARNLCPGDPAGPAPAGGGSNRAAPSRRRRDAPGAAGAARRVEGDGVIPPRR